MGFSWEAVAEVATTHKSVVTPA